MENNYKEGTTFPMKSTPYGKFDASYLLKHLSSTSPVDVAVHIDTAIEQLTTFLVEDGHARPYMVEPLEHLRKLRNDLLSGAGVVDFE